MNSIHTVKLLIAVCVVSLCSCQGSEKQVPGTEAGDSVATMRFVTDSNMITAAVDSNHTAQNALDWEGAYKGVVPCADCDGIETVILLKKDMTFNKTVKYLGKKDNLSVTAEGKFKWNGAMNIELEGLKDQPSKYSVMENKIVQLDMEGKKIEGPLADKYVLQKSN